MRIPTHLVGSRGLGPAGLPGNNNLVDRENGPGGLRGELDSPLLAHQQVQDALILGVQSARVILVLSEQLAKEQDPKSLKSNAPQYQHP